MEDGPILIFGLWQHKTSFAGVNVQHRVKLRVPAPVDSQASAGG